MPKYIDKLIQENGKSPVTMDKLIQERDELAQEIRVIGWVQRIRVTKEWAQRIRKTLGLNLVIFAALWIGSAIVGGTIPYNDDFLGLVIAFLPYFFVVGWLIYWARQWEFMRARAYRFTVIE